MKVGQTARKEWGSEETQEQINKKEGKRERVNIQPTEFSREICAGKQRSSDMACICWVMVTNAHIFLSFFVCVKSRDTCCVSKGLKGDI